MIRIYQFIVLLGTLAFSSISLSDNRFNHSRHSHHGYGHNSHHHPAAPILGAVGLGIVLATPRYVTIPTPVIGAPVYLTTPVTTLYYTGPIELPQNEILRIQPSNIAYYCPSKLNYYPQVTVCDIPWQLVYF